MPDPWGSPEPSIRTARRRPSSAPVPPPPPLDEDEIAERRRARERRQHTTTTTRTETDMAETKRERMRAHLEQVLADDPDVDSERVFEQLPLELGGMAYESFMAAYWYPLRREILGDGPGEEPAESQEDERSDPTPDPAPSSPPDEDEDESPDLKRLREYEETEVRAARATAAFGLAEASEDDPNALVLRTGKGCIEAHPLIDGRWKITGELDEATLSQLLYELIPLR